MTNAKAENKPKGPNLPAIHAKAMKLFNASVGNESVNRELQQEDNRFAAGYQWPADIEKERNDEDRPMITVNQLPKFIAQVVNDERKNRPAVKIRAVDDNTDPEKAEVFGGLFRSIWDRSRADIAGDTAIQNTATHGRGALLVKTQYVDEMSFDQEIIIGSVPNPFSVYYDTQMDPFNPENTSNYAFVNESITLESFEEAYPGKSHSETPQGEGDEYAWVEGDNVIIADYYYREFKEKKIYLLDDNTVVETEPEDKETVRGERITKIPSVKVCKISGGEILDGPNDWPGKYIPVIPVWGEWFFVDGKYDFRGIVRNAKDPQRMYNYWRTISAETLALAPKAPYIGTANMFKGYESMWGNANSSATSVLIYNIDEEAPQERPRREPPPAIGDSVTKESMIAAEEIKQTIGMFNENLGERSNATSGIAIEARKSEGDNATYAYIDNLARAMIHLGRVVVDMIPRVYDSARTVRIIGADGQEDFKALNENVTINDPNTEDPAIDAVLNDMSTGKVDVTVTIGPNYKTQRIEQSAEMMTMFNASPDLINLLGDIYFENQDHKGSDKMAARLKATLPPEIRNAKPGNKDEEEGPSAEQQQAMAAQQAEMQHVQAMKEIEAKIQSTKLAQEEAKLKGIQYDNDQKQLELQIQTGKLIPAEPEAVPA